MFGTDRTLRESEHVFTELSLTDRVRRQVFLYLPYYIFRVQMGERFELLLRNGGQTGLCLHCRRREERMGGGGARRGTVGQLLEL